MTRQSAITSAGEEYMRLRDARIAQNQARMRDLGLLSTVAELNQATEDANRPKPHKRKQYHVQVEPRRSERLQGSPAASLDENELFHKIDIDRLDLLATTRRRRVSVDPDRITSIFADRVREIDGEEAAARGPFDSGLGVRIQGGRVYDSKYGVTCHWCRQKTLEDHVECTAEGCGEGRKLAASFCRMCLRNRHGEDLDQAVASQRWVCPACRGSCGEGCVACCNCGPCRKRAGLGPTHQLIKEARAAGFSNVHDFLVHRATGEEASAITARKFSSPWGAWLAVPYEAHAEAAAAQDGQDGELAASSGPAAQAAISLSPQPAGKPTESEDTVTECRTGGEEDDDEDAGESSALFVAAPVVRAADTLNASAALTRKQRVMRKLGLAASA